MIRLEASPAACSSSGEGVKWLNARLRDLWAGEAGRLTAALQRKAKELGPRPERGERSGEPLAEGETNLPPVVVLWRAFDYFDDNRER